MSDGAMTRPAGRLTSIDALRGLTVAFMILVNDAGDAQHTYRELLHATWSGWTLTDLVFPTFLFLAGCSIVFSVNSRLERGATRGAISLQMLRRAATIFLLDILIAVYPHFHMTRIRIFGVLTRIAICYLIAGLLYVWVRRASWLVAIATMCVIAYWVLMRWVTVPGLGMPVRNIPLLDPDRNLTAWLDRGINAWCQAWLHTGRLYEKTRDPEGMLSTLPAIATALYGVLAALWMRRRGSATVCRNGLLAAGAASVMLGEVWNLWFPINKKLWTSSYVLLAGGLALLGLGVAYWLLDVKRVQERSRVARGVLWPLLVFGSNAIAAYAISEVAVETLEWWKVSDSDDTPVSVWRWIYAHGFAWNGSTRNTSLAFALAYVVCCFLPVWWLWRKKIFLKV